MYIYMYIYTYIYIHVYIYTYASTLEKSGTWVRLPANVRFFIYSVASFLLCCPYEALEGTNFVRVLRKILQR